jgi:osmotically-inducible protein OsmY
VTGVSERDARVNRAFGIRTAAVLGLTLLIGTGTEAAKPTPTPGPGARAGGAIDQAWSKVQEDVAQALLVVRVHIALLQHLKDDALQVKVEVKGSAVELSGQVHARASQELAKQAALSVSGVREVSNRITLAPGGENGEAPVSKAFGKVEREVADGLLEAKVKARLLEELGKVAFDIEVEATDGIVSLSGTVPDRARQQLAVSVAKSTKGVRELHDLLHVKK